MPKISNEQDVLSTREASQYLGMDYALLRYHIYERRHLKPDYKIGPNMAFKKSTLDDFKRLHQAEGLNMKQAADYLGVDIGHLRYHIFETKLLVPDGKRGRSYIFTRETLDAVKPVLRPKHQPLQQA